MQEHLNTDQFFEREKSALKFRDCEAMCLLHVSKEESLDALGIISQYCSN